MSQITDKQVESFIAGCQRRQPDCLDNGNFAVCKSCSKILLEIAAEVLAVTPLSADPPPLNRAVVPIFGIPDMSRYQDRT
jgi:hypothetical protein